jgi:KTSC domain
MMAIERKAIRRGGIKSAGYDRNQHVLEIEFDNGQVIQHTAVGEEIARRFLTASSPASVYKDTIQEEFTVKRIR